MLVRNLKDREVQETTYVAHRGGLARMVLTSHVMQGIEFLAHAMVPPGNILDEHVDAVEEIYYILRGGGIMKVGGEEREVTEGDAIWIAAGSSHAFENNTPRVTEILVVAAYPR